MFEVEEFSDRRDRMVMGEQPWITLSLPFECRATVSGGGETEKNGFIIQKKNPLTREEDVGKGEPLHDGALFVSRGVLLEVRKLVRVDRAFPFRSDECNSVERLHSCFDECDGNEHRRSAQTGDTVDADGRRRGALTHFFHQFEPFVDNFIGWRRAVGICHVL